MKSSCWQKDLAEALSLCRMLREKSSIISMEAQDGCIKIGMSDLSTTVLAEIAATTDEPGKLYLVGHRLLGIVSSLPQDRVELGIKGNSLHIKCGGHTLRLNTAIEEFIPSSDPITSEIPLASGQFTNLAQLVSIAATDDISKPALKGVLVELNDKELVMVSTDGLRLAHAKMSIPKSDIGAFVVQAQVLRDFCRLPKLKQPTPISVGFTHREIVLSAPGLQVRSLLISDRFPSFKEVIPKSSTTRATVNREELERAIKLAMSLASDNRLQLKVEEDKLVVSSASDVGESGNEIRGEVSGPGTTSTVNGKYLLEPVEALSGSHCYLELSYPTKPIVLRSPDTPEYLYLLMPIA